MTPWPILVLWLVESVVGFVFALRLLGQARRDLAAARRAVAEGLHPERIIPLGERYTTVKRLFVVAFAANVAAGLGALLREPFPELVFIVIPFLMVGNALFGVAMYVIDRMRHDGLAAIAADLADGKPIDAAQINVIKDVVQDNNDVLHRLEGTEGKAL